jgi:hypothetical protein
MSLRWNRLPFAVFTQVRSRDTRMNTPCSPYSGKRIVTGAPLAISRSAWRTDMDLNWVIVVLPCCDLIRHRVTVLRAGARFDLSSVARAILLAPDILPSIRERPQTSRNENRRQRSIRYLWNGRIQRGSEGLGAWSSEWSPCLIGHICHGVV